MFCPGAGWALLGYGKRGALVLASVAVCWMAVAWMLWTLSPASVWAAGLALLLALAVLSMELLDVGWCIIRPVPPGPLVRRFGLLTLVTWVAALAVPLLVLSRFAPLTMTYDRMSPTIEPGEQLVYHRHIESDLKAGTVILYQLSPQAKLGRPGEWVVARILAAPGDEVAIQRGHYVVNGEVTRYRAAVATPDAPVKVPPGKSLTVPDQRYFVVQDSAATGLDSQQLGWVRRGDLVSTRLFHFGGRGVLRPVE